MFESHLKPPISFPSVSGAVCSFDSQYAGLPLKSHSVAVTGYQSGSGTPSPSNPRALNGWSAITITANSVPTVIQIGTTVYGGTYDAITGVLTADYIIKTIDNNSGVAMSATAGIFYLEDFFDVDIDVNSVECNLYLRGENRRNTAQVINNEDYSFCCQTQTLTKRLMIKDMRFTNLTDYNTWLADNHVHIAVKQPDNTTIQLPPVRVETLAVNNISADTGDTTLQYIKLG